jgi:methionyl-tRNA formyltransferase
MFDTIILLTGEVEQPALSSLLRRHNPQLAVLPVERLEDLAAITTGMLRRSRLIAFATTVIVPGSVLDELGHGAYNFHPGPPEYPGWAPAHFALYDEADQFGVTLHAMVKRVDAGPIVDVARFPIPAGIGVAGVEERAYLQLIQMFARFAAALAGSAKPLAESEMQWSGKRNSRRAYQAICDIPLNIAKHDLERRIKVFGASHYGMSPTIYLHGIPFRAVMPDAAEA